MVRASVVGNLQGPFEESEMILHACRSVHDGFFSYLFVQNLDIAGRESSSNS